MRKIFDSLVIGREFTLAGDPADVRPKETALDRRVGVRLVVRMLMVVAMMSRPPKRSALDGRGSPEREYELRWARGFESPVREVSVIKTGDGEHPDEIEHGGRDGSDPTDAHPNHPQAAKMEKRKGNDSDPIKPVRQRTPVLDSSIAVKPLNYFREHRSNFNCT